MAESRKSIKKSMKSPDKGAEGKDKDKEASKDEAGPASPDVPTAKKRRRKEKKKVIEISLWVNNVKYEHGICKLKVPFVYASLLFKSWEYRVYPLQIYILYISCISYICILYVSYTVHYI